jgi:hypothetical protein
MPTIGRGRSAWLSVTPEPEFALPEAVATLSAGARATPWAVAAEQNRLEQLVLRGRRRPWDAYLHRIVGLIVAREGDPDPEVARARQIATAVIENHHNLLQALPGGGAKATAADRELLHRILNQTSGATTPDLPTMAGEER